MVERDHKGFIVGGRGDVHLAGSIQLTELT